MSNIQVDNLTTTSKDVVAVANLVKLFKSIKLDATTTDQVSLQALVSFINNFPSLTGKGKYILRANSGQTALEFVPGLPDVTSSDIGKSIVVGTDGASFALGGISPFTKSFTSSQMTFAIQTTTTVPHGLGVIPKYVYGELVCTTANNGYAVGERVALPHFFYAPASASANPNPRNVLITYDANNIYFTVTTSIYIADKVNLTTTTATTTAAPANFQIVMKAFA